MGHSQPCWLHALRHWVVEVPPRPLQASQRVMRMFFRHLLQYLSCVTLTGAVPPFDEVAAQLRPRGHGESQEARPQPTAGGTEVDTSLARSARRIPTAMPNCAA